MRRWPVILCSFALGAMMTAGAAWYIPSQMHASAAPVPAVADAPKELTSYRDIVVAYNIAREHGALRILDR